MQRTARRFRIAGALIAALALLAVTLLCWQLVSSQRTERALALEQTEQRAGQLAAAVAGRIDVLVRSVDFALLEVLREYAEYGAENAEFRKVAESLLKSFPEDSLLQLSIADAEGTLTYSNLGLAERISIRDREHFTVHLDGGDRLFISKPVLGRVSKRWSIQFSRPVLRQGRFAGVGVISISPENVAKLLAAFEVSRDDHVALFHGDGAFVSHNRRLEEVVGRVLAPARPFMQSGAPSRGTYRGVSFTDGRDRIFAWERIPNTALVANVGIDVQTALAPLERHFARSRTEAAILSVTVLGFGILVLALFARLSRKQQAIAESEARFQDFANASADWFWETDAEGRFIWISPQMEERIGQAPELCLGRRRIDVVAEGLDLGAEPWKSHLETLARREPFRDLVYRRQTPKGLKWLRVAGVPHFDQKGRFLGYRGSAADATEAIEVEERLRSALDHLSELVALCDAEDRIVYANRSFRELNAAVADHLAPGTPYVDHLRAGIALGLFPDAVGNEDAWLAERMALRRNPRGPVERRRQDGKWLMVWDQPLPDGGVISFGLDITERKRAEQALREREERLNKLFRNTPAAIAVVRFADGVILEINQAYEKIFGWQREEAVGSDAESLRVWVDPADRVRFRARLAADGRVTDFTSRARRRNGEVFDSTLSAETIEERGERLIFLVAADISERTRAEKSARVEHAVTRALAAATSAHSGIEQAMQVLSEANGWDLAEYWACDDAAGTMHRIAHWVSPVWPAAGRLIEHSRDTVFRRGEGLPGSAWQSAEPLWVEDLQNEPRMLRKALARDAGMRGALLAPVLAAGQVVGVLMFISRELRAPDARLQETIAAIGHQIGQLVQRRRAEDALHEQTERLRIGQSVARMIVLDWDVRNDRLDWSDSPVWLRGPVPAATGKYPPFKDQVHPDDREQFLAMRAKGLETLEDQTLEYRVIRTDGEVRWVLSRQSVVAAADGKAQRVVIALLDITERKRAEQVTWIEHTVTRNLAEAATVREGLEAVMRALCEANDWDLAEFWELDSAAGVMRRTAHWVSPEWPDARAFVDGSRDTAFERGVGLVGWVWQSGEPLWVADTSQDPRVLRKDLTRETAIRGGLLVPILASGQVTGVLEFSSGELRQPDARLQQAFGPIGQQIGQLIERKRAEQAALLAAERIRMAAQAARMFSWIWEIETDTLIWLEPPEPLLGPRPASGRYSDFRDLVHPQDREAYVAMSRQVMASGVEYEREFRILRTDGEVRWLRGRGKTILDARGRPTRMVGITLDVTERKHAEQALAASNALLRGILDSTADAILAQDAEGRIVAWNRRFVELSDIAEDVLRVSDVQAMFDLTLPRLENPERFRAEFYRIRADPAYVGTREFALKDGRVAERHTQPFEAEGGLAGRVWSFRDVTARAHAEREREADRQFLQSVLDALPTLVAVTDRAHRQVRVNRAMAELTGSRPEELLGRVHGEVYAEQAAEPAEAARVLAREEQVLVSGDPVGPYEVLRRDASGSPRYFRARKLPLRDAAGNITHVLTVGDDITVLRNTEEQLRRLNDELERRVQERTTALQGALRELESFSYSISHDLRAPARAVAGFSRIVIEDYAAQLPEEGRRLLARISKAGEAMGAMVDGLLELARLSRGEVLRRAVDLVALAAEVWRDLAALEPGRKVELHLDAELRAEGDPVLLRNLLLNLLGNARKYTRQRADAAVWFGRTPQGEYFVRDNGVGFDPAHAAKLFGAFQRLHTEREFEGHGIGLALARKIVEHHGGTIRAEATSGKGATFYFTLDGSRYPA